MFLTPGSTPSFGNPGLLPALGKEPGPLLLCANGILLLLDCWGEEARAPGARLAFAEVAGAAAWVARSVLNAGKVSGDNEVELAGGVL